MRRKKLHWKEIPTDRFAPDSFWAAEGGVSLDFDFDKKEFEALFVSVGRSGSF